MGNNRERLGAGDHSRPDDLFTQERTVPVKYVDLSVQAEHVKQLKTKMFNSH